jgi:hypothetical protein
MAPGIQNTSQWNKTTIVQQRPSREVVLIVSSPWLKSKKEISPVKISLTKLTDLSVGIFLCIQEVLRPNLGRDTGYPD